LYRGNVMVVRYIRQADGGPMELAQRHSVKHFNVCNLLKTPIWKGYNIVVFVGEQDIQPLRVLHLGADEVPQDALKHSSVCRHLLVDSSNAGVVLRLHFIRLAVDISARLGVDTVQVRVNSSPGNTNNNWEFLMVSTR